MELESKNDPETTGILIIHIFSTIIEHFSKEMLQKIITVRTMLKLTIIRQKARGKHSYQQEEKLKALH